MNSHVIPGIDRPSGHASIDEWIVETLCRRGPLTLDYLNSLFPTCDESRLLFAVDRLSRIGQIVIHPPQGGDYLISARVAEEVPVIRRYGRSLSEQGESAFAHSK